MKSWLESLTLMPMLHELSTPPPFPVGQNALASTRDLSNAGLDLRCWYPSGSSPSSFLLRLLLFRFFNSLRMISGPTFEA